MVTYATLWLRHLVACRRGCRQSQPGESCKIGKVAFRLWQSEVLDAAP